MDAVSQALALAQQQAAAMVPPPAVPATYVAPGTPVTMDDMLVGSMSVDAWLKVKEFGLLISSDPSILLTDPIEVIIDLSRVSPSFQIKYGNPAVYKKSFDHVTCVTGGSWADAVATAQRVDSRAREYRSVDLPMVVTKSVVAKGKTLIEVGKTLGHSTSTTNWKNWVEFYRAAVEGGYKDAPVKVALGYEPRANANNTWGVVTFALLGPAEVN